MKKDLLKEIRNSRFGGYQRIDLGCGIILEGADRRSTANIIFPRDLMGKDVIDFGCHSGFFCIEAKRRGANRVLGIDTIFGKVELAKNIAKYVGLDISYEQHDIESWHTNERFDIVLLLNVIHHLKDPIGTIRKLMNMCTRRVVIEFPDILSSELNISQKAKKSLNKHPVMAVNTVSKSNINHQEYRYLFSPSFIKRLAGQQLGCKSVKIIESPFKRHRHIAVLSK